MDQSYNLFNRIFSALILLLFLPGVYLTVADLTPAPHQEDFGAYYVAARALASGESPYDAEAADRLAAASGVEHHAGYIYPSLLALLLRPFTALPYSAAAATWFVLSVGALLAALSLLRPVVQLPWRIYGWVCASVFFLPPVHHTLQHGQITNFLLLLIVAGSAGGTGRAAWVGIAAALKIFPATLAVVYALSGRIAGLVVMGGSAAILTLAAALMAPAATVDFVRRVRPQLGFEQRLAPNNQSVEAVMARWFETHWFVTPIVDAPVVARIASSLAILLVVGLTFRALVSVRRADGAMVQLRRFSLVLAATLIVSPIVWDHYYVLLLFPVAVLYRSSDDRTVRRLLLAAGVLLLSHRYWPLAFPLKSPMFMSEGLAGVVLLWIALLKVLSYDRVCAERLSPLAASPSAI
ncbi:MAG: glycosyltransferase family 87 protein [Vicinamibacterales bacterium]